MAAALPAVRLQGRSERGFPTTSDRITKGRFIRAQGACPSRQATPLLLPPHRRPPHLDGGYGKDPAWEILEDQLGIDLGFRPDLREPREHGFIEPSSVVLVEEYREALCNTAPRWRRV